jgi:hypothetical protein
VELINIILKHVPKEEWRKVGQEAGEATRISMAASLDLQSAEKENWTEVFKRLRVQGFGDFYVRDKYIIVKTPFVNNSEVLVGFLEGLLKVQLVAKTSSPPMIFELTG